MHHNSSYIQRIATISVTNPIHVWVADSAMVNNSESC